MSIIIIRQPSVSPDLHQILLILYKYNMYSLFHFLFIVPAENIQVDIPNKKLTVTSEKTIQELQDALAKTGKEVSHVATL